MTNVYTDVDGAFLDFAFDENNVDDDDDICCVRKKVSIFIQTTRSSDEKIDRIG